VNPSSRSRPYKFLDFYTEEDRNLFFGREREIDTLLSDIITSRLVLLFARTGTGKSSLINAGVRPRLHDDDYKTVVSRTGDDPAARARLALQKEQMFSGEWGGSFAADMIGVVDEMQRPLVIFFDQFEEFFLTGVEREVQLSFIREVGKLYRNAHSGVHLVFSLREDYLAEMDLFRDEIPTIFEKESQLRLRPFTRDQAREAILGPTRVFSPRFSYATALPDVIIDDLLTGDGVVHPAELQIVCDTLWQERKRGEIQLWLYEKLGRADGILEQRIVQDLERLSADSVLLLERALPELRTEDGTKRARSVPELASTLAVKPRKLEELVSTLGAQRLIRTEPWDDEVYIEWISDHAASLSRKLEPALQHISLRKAKEAGLTLPEARVLTLLNNEKLCERLDEREWRFLLRQAAATRDLLGLWYAKATRAGQPVWTIIGKLLDSSDKLDESKAQRLILYLGEFPQPSAITILAEQLRERDRARIALRALGALGDARSIELIREAAKKPELQAAAADALRAIGTPETLAAAETVQKRGRRLADFWPFGGAPTLSSREWFAWDAVVDVVRGGEVAVLLGPGVTRASTLAATLAERFDYPFTETGNLLGIVQYLNVAFGQGWTRVVSGYDFKPTAMTQAVAAWPVKTFVTSDPTVEIVRALEAIGKTPAIGTVRGERTESSSGPVVIPLFGHILQPETLIDPSLRTIAMLGEWPVERPRVLISLGYEIGDGEPESVRIAWTGGGNEMFALIKVVRSPELTSVRHDRRAFEYFDQYARATGIYHYFGETEEFVNGLTGRLATA
jgi:hypothetical protein